MRKFLALAVLVVPMTTLANSRTGTMRSLPPEIPNISAFDSGSLMVPAVSRTGTLAISPEAVIRIANSRTGTMAKSNDQVKFDEKLSSGEIRFQVTNPMAEDAKTFVLAPNEFSAAERVYLQALARSKSLQATGSAGWVEVASDRQGGGGL